MKKKTTTPKPASPEAEYFLKLLQKKDPEHGALYRVSKRTGIHRGTLHNSMYKRKQPFKQAHILMLLAADIGVSPESILSQTETDYDRDKELNHWKERTFKAESELKKYKQEVKKTIKNL